MRLSSLSGKGPPSRESVQCSMMLALRLFRSALRTETSGVKSACAAPRIIVQMKERSESSEKDKVRNDALDCCCGVVDAVAPTADI